MDQLVFQTSSLEVRAATRADFPALGQFCRENPDYDVFLTGEVPDQNDWVEDFLTDVPPAHFGWTLTHKLIAVVRNETTDIVAVIDVTEDMIGKDVGHIGLFQVAQKLHGCGVAQEVYDGLEHWLMSRGMQVIRLGVLDGNARGLAFWTRLDFRETRTRDGIAPTGKSHQSHVMYKPLKPMTSDAYRQLVPRDHPDSP